MKSDLTIPDNTETIEKELDGWMKANELLAKSKDRWKNGHDQLKRKLEDKEEEIESNLKTIEILHDYIILEFKIRSKPFDEEDYKCTQSEIEDMLKYHGFEPIKPFEHSIEKMRLLAFQMAVLARKGE